MKFKSLLIISYGRSGSTLLQGMLNSIDGCLIRGENLNLCFHLFNAWESISELKKNFSPKVESPWYGSHLVDDELFISHCKQFMYQMLVESTTDKENIKCYGFKEIRYTNIGDENFVNYLNFLKMIFPGPVFIFNTRNHEDVSKSSWLASHDKHEVINILQETEKRFFSYIKENPKNSFHITYEDVISKSVKMKEMFDFIGALYNENVINRILSIQHSTKSV